MNTLTVLFDRYLGRLSGVFLASMILLFIVALVALRNCDRAKMKFLYRLFSFSLETEKRKPDR
jgi:hypothetical protein